MSNHGVSEYDHYKDEGCEVSPSCLRCPLPVCKYDDPRAYGIYRRNQLIDTPIMAALNSGLSVGATSRQCSVDIRTVFRVMARNGWKDA